MSNRNRVEAVVDLNALRQNIQNLKSRIPATTKFCAVIKADGYGHGAVPIARAAHGLADWFGVATAEEALELRGQGIFEPILILGYVPDQYYGDLIRADVRLCVYEWTVAKKISDQAERIGKKAKIHIKLDTGMGRLGFFPSEESATVIESIRDLPFLELEGLFTHFACADEADKTMVNRQIQRYSQMAALLKKRGISFPLKHCANSAGILDRHAQDMDMVRAGIVLYGLYPSKQVSRETALTPVLELKSHIVSLKEVPAGEPISYGAAYVTKRPTKVAAIPVGYADGYPRALSNQGWVLVRGKRAPVIGRVCMDQFMVDVTDVPGVQNGDPVTLIGKDGDEVVTADDLARLTGTIHYEIVSCLGKRIPRVYTLTHSEAARLPEGL